MEFVDRHIRTDYIDFGDSRECQGSRDVRSLGEMDGSKMKVEVNLVC